MDPFSGSKKVKLANINGEIIAFCKTSDFKRYVRDAINDEIFWRNILKTYSVSSMVQSELNNKIPTQVQNEANKIVSSMVQDKLNNYTQFQIPAQVAKALSEQINNFLNNNAQMNQILATHSETLNLQLYNNAMKTLHEIVNEPQYHLVTNEHIKAIKSKYEDSLRIMDADARRQITQNEASFRSQLEGFRHQVDSETKSLTETRVKLGQAENRIVDLDNKLSSFKTLFGVVCGFCVIGFAAMYHVVVNK